MWCKWGENMVNIIYEDNHILVCVKPQNIPTQKDESGDMDMQTEIKEYLKEKYQKPGNVFVGIVHRLDRVTGGLMVFAKTSKAAKRLSEQIKSGEFKKSYLAVTNGILKQKKGTLVNYLKKDNFTNMVSLVSKTTPLAKEAKLDYEVISEKDGLSLLKINLHTGRSHQIRVQLRGVNAPIYGDHRYGFAKSGNLALWAYKLSFYHPTKNEKQTYIFLTTIENPWNFFNKEINNIK